MKIRYINRNVLLSLSFYFVMLLVYNHYTYTNYKEKEIFFIDDKLRIAANVVYDLLGEEFFLTAMKKDSINIKQDWENINKLTKYKNYSNLGFLYSSIKVDDKIYLTSSSASEEELLHNVQVHYFYHYKTAPKGLYESFDEMKVIYENYIDKWGSFRTVHIPKKLNNGQVIVLSAEISLSLFEEILINVKYRYLIESILYIILLIPIIITLYLSIKEKNDIKIRIEKKHLKEKIELIDNTIKDIAHQWRQPLSIITALSSGLKLKKELGVLSDRELNNSCEQITENTKYLSKTIDNFSHFSKSENDKTFYEIKERIKYFSNLIKPTSKFTNTKLIIHIEDDIKIFGYPNELIQCLLNLFENSENALNKANIDVKYVFVDVRKKKEKVILKFKDNAGGISEELLGKIFQPYFTTEHKSQNKGMGLYTVYKLIVECMQGNINARNNIYKYKNKEYKGLEFAIELDIG